MFQVPVEMIVNEFTNDKRKHQKDKTFSFPFSLLIRNGGIKHSYNTLLLFYSVLFRLPIHMSLFRKKTEYFKTNKYEAMPLKFNNTGFRYK